MFIKLKSIKPEFLEFGKGFLKFSLIPAITRFGNIFLLPLYMSVIDPATFGKIGTILTMSALISPILNLSAEGVLNNFYFEWKDKEKKFNSFIVIALIGSFFSSLIFFQIFSYISFFNGIAAFIIIIAMNDSIMRVIFNLIRLQEKINTYVTLSLVNFAITNSYILFNIFSSPTADTYIYGIIIGQLLLLFIFFIRCLAGMLKFGFSRFDSFLLEINFAIGYLPNIVTDQISTNVDKVLLSVILSNNLFGQYFIARRFSDVLREGIGAALNYFIPKSIKQIKENNPEKFSEISKYFYWFSIAVINIGVICIFIFLKLINNPEYNLVITFIPLMSIVILSQIYYAPYSTILFCFKKFWAIFLGTISEFTVYLSLALLLFFTNTISISLLIVLQVLASLLRALIIVFANNDSAFKPKLTLSLAIGYTISLSICIVLSLNY